jgi:hypothetical protein
MAKINYKALRESYEKYPDRAPALLEEALAAKDIDPGNFSFQALYREWFGEGAMAALDPAHRGDRLVSRDVFEHAGAVSTANFAGIIRQIIYNMALPGYQGEGYPFSDLIPERPSKFQNELVAGMSEVGPGNDAEWLTPEGEPYNYAGFGPNYINLPKTQKRGKIVALTREILFFDQTNLVAERARGVGDGLRAGREDRAIDCVIDENGGAKSATQGGHRYHWMGNSIATYGDSSGNHNFDNLVASNALVDWTNIDAIEQNIANVTDPFTGLPIVLDQTYLITTWQLRQQANRILTATELINTAPGFATSGAPTQTRYNNPYSGIVKHLTSRRLAQRLATDTSWFYGSPQKAFVYVVHFPFQVIQAPPNSTEEFNRDIVLQVRADEMGNYGTLDPRYMQKATA